MLNTLDNTREKPSHEKSGRFSSLLANAVYGICLNVKSHVLATHREIAILRRCSELIRQDPNRIVQIVVREHNKQSYFIHKTLLHLGVSCGRIAINTTVDDVESPQGIWLLVGNA